ncbi:hypothetical protein Tco_0722751, partial [Tanacetum coccineum]
MALPPRDQSTNTLGGLPDLMAEGLSARMLMEHKDAQGVSLFTSRAWRRLFDIREPLVHELILEFFSTFRFGEAILDLDTPGALQISSARDFLGTASSYTSIRDLILRLCHRLIACIIAGRSQAPKKVTVTGLFYLRGMDAWVAMGPERQPDVVAGAPGAIEDALAVDEDMPQAVPPPPP